jgi:hypothetical protein
MTIYEKYEIEKEEDNLIGSLANINQSIKSKDKNLFLENISDFYRINLIQYCTDKEKGDLNKNILNNQKDNKIKFKIKKNVKEKNKPEKNEEDILYSCPRSFSFESLKNININFNELRKNLDVLNINKKTTNKNNKEKINGKEKIQNKNNPFNLIIKNPIFSQNILPTENNLKLFMVGDEKVGKSFFIEKFLKKENDIEYKKTESMEIYKNIIHLINKYVKIEVYDTNKQILNSLMLKSK